MLLELNGSSGLRLVLFLYPLHHLLLVDEHLLEGVEVRLQVLQLHLAVLRGRDGGSHLLGSLCKVGKEGEECDFKCHFGNQIVETEDLLVQCPLSTVERETEVKRISISRISFDTI